MFYFLVQDGQVVVSYNLGSGPTSVTAPKNIIDGDLHEIQIHIHKREQLIISTGLTPTQDWECTVKVDESEEMPQSNEVNVIFNILICSVSTQAFYSLTY